MSTTPKQTTSVPMTVSRHHLLTAVLVAGHCAGLLAHFPQHAKCVWSEKAPKLDGVLDEWGRAAPIRVRHVDRSFGKAKGDDDASYVCYTLWNNECLFVAVDVRDSSLVCNSVGNRLYENDCLELSIDARHDSESEYQEDDYQFVFAPSGPSGRPQTWLFRNPIHGNAAPDGVQVAAKTREDGYVLEIAIRWLALGRDAPDLGQVIGFQHDIRDYDEDDSVKGLCWIPASDPAANPLNWGDLIFVRSKQQSVDKVLAAMEKDIARYQRLLFGVAKELSNEVMVTVGDGVTKVLDFGIGWNWQYYDGFVPEWTEDEWQAFLGLLAWTKPHWVRYGLNLCHWEPENDDDDPQHFNWAGFKFDSTIMRHHYRMLDFCEERGIDVLVCNWYVGDKASGSTWLAETVRDPELQDTDGNPVNDAPYDPRELVESVAALLHQLKTVKKYQCIKYVSLWNEPDGDWAYQSPNARYPDAFWPMYPMLDKRLRQLGLRGQIGIVGPDTSTFSYYAMLGIPELIAQYGKTIDVVADHDYAAFLDYKRLDNSSPISSGIKAYATIQEKLKTLYGREMPFVITEFGNMGNGPGPVVGADEVFVGSLSTIELMLRGLNAGVDGFLRWEFKPYEVDWQCFGALTSTQKELLFAPYPPVYFPHSLISRHMPKGSKVLSVETSGGADENGTARVAACGIRSPADEFSVFAVNNGFTDKRVTVDVAQLLKQAEVVHLYYDSSRPRRFQRGSDLTVEAGRFRATVTPRSLNVFTTIDSSLAESVLDEPWRLAPKRTEPSYTAIRHGGGPAERAAFGFERPTTWHVWRSSSGGTTFGVSQERFHAGKSSCRVAYDFVSADTGGREEHVVATTAVQLDGLPQRLSFWLHGDGQGHQLKFHFVDADGETFSCSEPIAITWRGWRKIERDTSAMPKGWGNWGSEANDIVDLPITGVGFALHEREREYVGKGSLYIDELEIISLAQRGEEAK